MALSEKQYYALRAQAIAEASSKGVSEEELDEYQGELFPGEREYLIRMNPRGGSKGASGMLGILALIAVLLFFMI